MSTEREIDPGKITETSVDETVEESFPASDPPSHSSASSTEPAPSSGYDEKAEAQRAKISDRAHSIWEEQGRPDGKHVEHWDQAERENSPPRSRRPMSL